MTVSAALPAEAESGPESDAEAGLRPRPARPLPPRLLAPGGRQRLGAAETAGPSRPGPVAAVPMRQALEAHQRGPIEQAVARNGGNWAAAARDLGVHRSNLHHLARRLGLKSEASS